MMSETEVLEKLTSYKDAIIKLKQERDEARSKVSNMEVELIDLRKDLEACNNIILEKDTKIAGVQSTNEQLRQENSELSTKIQDLTTEKANLETDLNNVKSQLQNLQSQSQQNQQESAAAKDAFMQELSRVLNEASSALTED